MCKLIILSVAMLWASDYSKSFQNFNNWHSTLKNKEIKKLKELKIIFVPGLFSTPLMAGRNKAFGYFSGAIDFLESIGFHNYEVVNTYSQRPSSHSHHLIAEVIQNSSQKILFVGHSKGNTDILSTLDQHKELKKNIFGMISIQAAFHGSPVIDDLYENPFTHFLLKGFMKALNGSIHTIQELTTHESKKKVKKYKRMAKKEFLFLNFSSYIHRDESMGVPLLNLFANRLHKRGILGDGLVPYQSSLLNNCNYIIAPNMDHSDTIMNINDKVQAQVFFKSLLKVFFKIAENKNSGPYRNHSK